MGKRISNKTVQWIVYKYLNAAGLEYKHFSVHKLRHTAATLMYQEGGVDVLALKEILGHAQLSTTQIYTHISDKRLEEAVSKNPLAQLTSGELAKNWTAAMKIREVPCKKGENKEHMFTSSGLLWYNIGTAQVSSFERGWPAPCSFFRNGMTC